MQSLTKGVALAAQSTLGTASTTGFHRGRFTRSRSIPIFDYAEYLNEHSGVHQRASERQSQSERTAVIIPIRLEGALYPNFIGAALRGLGFTDTPTDNTTHKSHAFVKANVDAAVYCSMLEAIGEGAERFEHKTKDIRLTAWTLEATRRTLQSSFDGFGLSEVNSSGTETVVAEPVFKLLSTKGALAFGAQALGTPRSHTFNLRRPVDEEDQLLHAFGRADLPEAGFAVDGQLRGLTMSAALYNKLVRGGSGGTAVSQVTITDSLTFSYATPADISGAVVPYSLQIALTKVELMLMNFEAAGNAIVRGDVDYRMVDDVSAAPITITLINGVASY